MFEQFFSQASNTEALFVSLYFVGFVSPMMIVMLLSFMVHLSWRPLHDLQRLNLMNVLSNISDHFGMKTQIVFLMTLIVIGIGLLKMNQTVAAVIWSVTTMWFWAWISIWKEVYPLDRVIEILDGELTSRFSSDPLCEPC